MFGGPFLIFKVGAEVVRLCYTNGASWSLPDILRPLWLPGASCGFLGAFWSFLGWILAWRCFWGSVEVSWGFLGFLGPPGACWSLVGCILALWCLLVGFLPSRGPGAPILVP